MKQQIVIIHGGSAYDTYEEFLKDLKEWKLDVDELRSTKQEGWKDSLVKELGSGFDVLYPEMPNWSNAHYPEWKIWFEKIIPFLNDQPVILIGHSLGAIFLAQYLAENIFPKKIKGVPAIKALFLISGPYKPVGVKDSLGDFITPADLSKIQTQCDSVFIYHSKDDPIVDFENAEKYAAALPKAKLVVFKDKKHFNQSEFPELVAQIRDLPKG
jgi:predicted alpha/beta hydrolase family esterase